MNQRSLQLEAGRQVEDTETSTTNIIVRLATTILIILHHRLLEEIDSVDQQEKCRADIPREQVNTFNRVVAPAPTVIYFYYNNHCNSYFCLLFHP